MCDVYCGLEWIGLSYSSVFIVMYAPQTFYFVFSPFWFSLIVVVSIIIIIIVCFFCSSFFFHEFFSILFILTIILFFFLAAYNCFATVDFLFHRPCLVCSFFLLLLLLLRRASERAFAWEKL